MRLPAATAIELAPAQATPRADIEKAARELETQFAHMLIKSMRSASPGGGLEGDTRYRDMYDQQLARELSRGRGLGLAPMIVRQLERSAGDTDAASPAPASPATIPLRMHGQPPGMLPLSPAGTSGMLPLAPTRSGVSMPGLDLQAHAPQRPAMSEPGFDLSAPAVADDAPLDTSSPEAFVRSIWPQAQKAAAELGVPAKALVAQAALETGWGRRFAGREGTSSLNLFGIKATGGWKGDRMGANTHEFVGGRRVEERAQFRAYGSVGESFADYVRLIGKERYAAARGAGQDVHRFASALQKAGYATDPSYAAKITAIANGATLNRALASLPTRADAFDHVASAAPGAGASHALASAAGKRG